MKKILCSITAYLLLVFSINAQTFEWVRTIGSQSLDIASSIAVDDSGNVYTTGYFRDTVDFDPGLGTNIQVSNGNNDIFVQKMDANGNLLWVKTFGSNSDDSGNSIMVNDSGHVYTTGTFSNTVDFDPGVGTALLSNGSGQTIFIQKLDASGNLLWVKGIGGQSGNSTQDANGNVYTTGSFGGTIDLDPSSGTFNVTSVGLIDVYIQKMDVLGNFLWAKSIGGSNTVFGGGIVVDAIGNIYNTGYFQGTADFDPGINTFNKSAIGLWDVFVLKLDTLGNFVWAQTFGSSGFDRSNAIELDNYGNVYTTGRFQGTTDFDPGTGIFNLSPAGFDDVFVHKIDKNGNFIWAKAFGGASSDQGYSIALDIYGNVYTSGQFRDTADFDPGPGRAQLNSFGLDDTFIQKLDSSGNFIWAKAFNGLNSNIAIDLSVDFSENIYTCGFFQDSTNFDPPNTTTQLIPVGARDIFIHKMNQTATGNIEIEEGIQFSVFPNPTKEIIQLRFEKSLHNVTVELRDINGRLVYYNTFNRMENETFNIKGASGMYFLKVKSEKSETVIKLIKE